MTKPPGLTDNPWQKLRQFTDARIALGRCGVSQPTAAHLEFQLNHAQARDAVHLPLETKALCEGVAHLSLAADPTPRQLHSAAEDRMTYLRRPDLGRQLSEASRALLSSPDNTPTPPCDLLLIIIDGLSAQAVNRHAVPFVKALHDALLANTDTWTLAPPCVVTQGRVAIGDEIGEALNARATLVIIGERPGLSSPDSLGVYLTWNPKPGRSDAERNCISNIRPAGLSLTAAAEKACYLLGEARRLNGSGVALKDRSDGEALMPAESGKNFLIGR
ncbi:MAG: ethanolamine ammonia-lyase subunit EutC [Halomonadaceae bacterium]|nr:MAG: ethanolamine ammonia-lyase subunit EutC [Halomonadaceae bacterium]